MQWGIYVCMYIYYRVFIPDVFVSPWFSAMYVAERLFFEIHSINENESEIKYTNLPEHYSMLKLSFTFTCCYDKFRYFVLYLARKVKYIDKVYKVRNIKRYL